MQRCCGCHRSANRHNKSGLLLCFAGCADLHLLDMLTPTERKRQGYIHELIVTEENYVNDLQLVTEVGQLCGLGPLLLQPKQVLQ